MTASVTIEEGKYGVLPHIKLSLPEHNSSCDICIFGATLTSWVKNGIEKIFVSRNAIYNGVKAIRGGVPLVFPQFGQPDKTMSQHGFARTSHWNIVSLDVLSESSVSAKLSLTHNAETLALWPNMFLLEYEVVLTASTLTCTLRITNTDPAVDASEGFLCHSLLHTYLTINDINSLQVEGFQSRSFIDKMANNELFVEERAIATIDKETDRVYIGDAEKEESGLYGTLIASFTAAAAGAEGGQECIRVSPSAKLIDANNVTTTRLACDVVFWNPWIDKARSLADLGEESYPQFVCIEPGTVNDYIRVGPSHTLQLEQVLE